MSQEQRDLEPDDTPFAELVNATKRVDDLETSQQIGEQTQKYITPALRQASTMYRAQLFRLCAAATFSHGGTAWSERHRRMFICFAGLLQGIEVTEHLTNQGLYIKACTSLRQDIEYLASIHEISTGSIRKKHSAMNSLPEFAKYYGQLSDVAHASRDESLASRVLHRGNAVSVAPKFSPSNAEWLFELITWFYDRVLSELCALFLETHIAADILPSAITEQQKIRRLLIGAGYMKSGGLRAPSWRSDFPHTTPVDT